MAVWLEGYFEDGDILEFFTLTSNCLLHLGISLLHRELLFPYDGKTTQNTVAYTSQVEVRELISLHYKDVYLPHLECFLLLVEFRACFSNVGVHQNHMKHLFKMQISGPHQTLYVVV